VFISTSQLRISLDALSDVHPFFGTSFLAFKKFGLPVGTSVPVVFTQIVEDILQTYYKPRPDYPGFYSPFKTSDKTKRWNAKRYGSTTLQRITSDTFADVFIHEKGTRNWGWKPDYIQILRSNHLEGRPVPAFDLAIWLFRDHQWESQTLPKDVINLFYDTFSVTSEEQTHLFSNATKLAQDWLQSDQQISISYINPPQDDIIAPSLWSSRELEILQVIDNITFESFVHGTTLKHLRLENIGHIDLIDFEPANRLNIITGENGIGKTFILDNVWWALTGTDTKFYLPSQNDFIPKITFSTGTESISTTAYEFVLTDTRSVQKSRRKDLPGLVLYSCFDGSFKVWNSVRLFNNLNNIAIRSDQVWEGIAGSNTFTGLISNWLRWQKEENEYFGAFSFALETLSPHSEKLIPGDPITLNNGSSVPSLKFAFGDVPIVYCSAGIKRIISIAFMLIWAWRGYSDSSNVNLPKQRSIILLIDEIEAHLHPIWQRTILPAILEVISFLAGEENTQTQLFSITHSPMVLASIETRFEYDKDKVFYLTISEEQNKKVEINEFEFVKRGTSDLWLMSDVFGLKHPRSKEGEDAIEEATRLQLEDSIDSEHIRKVFRRLIEVLAPDDVFWPSWVYLAETKGVRL